MREPFRVLYVASPLNHRSPWPYMRPCRYYRFLKDIVAALRAVAESPAFRVQFRPHIQADGPGNPVPALFRGSRVEVLTRRRVPRLYDQADLVLLDLGGTCLLEALAAGRWVWVYEDRETWGPLTPEAERLLPASAQVFTDPARFLGAIRALPELTP